MQIPLEIAFRHVDPSEWAEESIRKHVDGLERIYDRMTACRVRVERRARNATNSVPPVVRIEIGIPGRRDLVVSHEPGHLQKKFQDPDLRNAINEAFRIAERRLLDLKEQRTRRTKQARHDGPRQLPGEVAEIHPEADHGFLLTNGGAMLYFHRNGLLTGDFDALKQGDPVFYVEDMGDTGPIATKVRVRTGNGS